QAVAADMPARLKTNAGMNQPHTRAGVKIVLVQPPLGNGLPMAHLLGLGAIDLGLAAEKARDGRLLVQLLIEALQRGPEMSRDDRAGRNKPLTGSFIQTNEVEAGLQIIRGTCLHGPFQKRTSS